jgi:beta-glucanase (GH16 family)
MKKSLSTTAVNKVMFFDDFSTSSLETSHWNIRITGSVVNNEQQAYVDSSEVIFIQDQRKETGSDSGGILVIKAQHHPAYTAPDGKQFDFLSARIDTRDKFEFLYGTAAARMKLPHGCGLWPAFWAMGYGNWPENGEIDIMENVGITDWISAGIHGPGYSGEDGLINQYYFSNLEDTTNWHTYSVDWGPQEMLFRVDGKLIYRVTVEMAQFFGTWVFDNPKFLILNLAIGGKYPYKINGVQKPYYGLPEETIRIIDKDRARLLIDWVKVSSHD